MVPVVVLAGLAALIAWAVRPKTTGIVAEPTLMGYAAPAALPPASSAIPPGLLAPPTTEPLSPESERLVSLLVLFARDKKYPAGKKRYLSANTALEAVKLARALDMPKTAMAIRRDGAVPDDETIPGRPESIRASVLTYGTKGRM